MNEPEILGSVQALVKGAKEEIFLSASGMRLGQGPIIPWDQMRKISPSSSSVKILYEEGGARKKLVLAPVPKRLGLTSSGDAMALSDEIEHYWLADRIASKLEGAGASSSSGKSVGERVGLVAIAVKIGPKLLGLLGKLGAAGAKAGLAVATFAGLAFLHSWHFAALLMGMLFVHEYGHVHAMKRSGMKVKGIYYLPFLGAVSVGEGEWPSKRAQAYIALNGPWWGTILSAFALLGYFVTGRQHPSLGVIASWWGVINLFNLIPMNPLDGGRLLSAVTGSIHKVLGIVIVVLCLVLAVLLALSLQLTLIWILGAIGLWELWGQRKAQRMQPAYEAFMSDRSVQGEEITPRNCREMMKRLAETLKVSAFKRGLLLQNLRNRLRKIHKGSAPVAPTQEVFEASVSAVLPLRRKSQGNVEEMTGGQIGLYSGYYVGLVILLGIIVLLGSAIGQQAGKAAFDVLR